MNVCIEAVAAEAVVVMTIAGVVVSSMDIISTFKVATAPVLRNLLRAGKTSLSAVAPDFNLLGGMAVA